MLSCPVETPRYNCSGSSDGVMMVMFSSKLAAMPAYIMMIRSIVIISFILSLSLSLDIYIYIVP